MYHLKRLLPAFVEALGFSHVLVLFDDVVVAPGGPEHVRRFVRIAAANDVSVATPRVKGASRGIMARQTAECRIGRFVSRIEFFAVLFTPRAYRCWFELIDPSINGIGWGYEKVLEPYCQRWFSPSQKFRTAIVDEFVAAHVGRTLINKSQPSTYALAEADQGERAMFADLRARGLPHTYRKSAMNYGCLRDEPGRNASLNASERRANVSTRHLKLRAGF